MKINIRLIINKEIFWQDKNILVDEKKQIDVMEI